MGLDRLPAEFARVRAGLHRVAEELVDWRASTALEDGLRNTVAWYAENLGAASAGEPVR